MSIPNNVNPLFNSGTIAPTGYTIDRSLRFNSSDSAYCSRVAVTPTDATKFTLSFWIKRSKLSAYQVVMYAGLDSNNKLDLIAFTDGDAIQLRQRRSATDYISTTNAVFRDCSAWYHIVYSWSSGTRVLYVNGISQSFASSSTTTSAHYWQTSGRTIYIGRDNNEGGSPFGYGDFLLSEVLFIDGSALDPTSFAETNATTGQWVPKAYTGSYGTNGFKLTFSDNSGTTATTLGKDAAGSNNWTPNNFSVAAGAGNDSVVDTPSSGSQVDTGLGGQVTGNYATLNPLAKGSDVSLANGNLDCSTSSGAGFSSVLATIGVTAGKWYWEFTAGSGTLRIGLGIATQAHNLSTWLGGDAYGWEYFNNDGSKATNGGGGAYGATWTTGDVIGVALDADAGTLTFYKNGATQGQAYSGLASGPYFPAVADSGAAGILAGSFNFGQRPFAYTAPSGFKALCDTNLPAPVVAQPSTVMDVKLYTGNGSTQTISGLGFSPDLVWCKVRGNGVAQHVIYDSVRGAHKRLTPNGTTAEIDVNPYGVTAFSLTGFTVADNFNGNYEINGDPTGTYGTGGYAAWCFDAGSNTVSNTAGSITSQVRANASAGFSIVTYAGTGGTGTVGHGLGVAPSMIIVKNRSNAVNWAVAHAGIDSNRCLNLNRDVDASTVGFLGLDKSSFTSTTFTVNYSDTNTTVVNGSSNNYVAYCFAPVAGYSSFGSYTGNGTANDGPFVYTGFKPKWVMVKCSSAGTTAWTIWDAQRPGYNVTNLRLRPNSSEAEQTDGFNHCDFLSNGFKVRGSAGLDSNTSSATYIYCAFAESPFQYARAR